MVTPYPSNTRDVVFLAWLTSSVQFSHSIVYDSLRPHGLHHARLHRPSPTPRACSNSCPLSRWCHPIISSSAVRFSSCLQSFWSGKHQVLFQWSQFFTSGDQSIRVSASASVLPMNSQDWSPSEWTGWISLPSSDSQESSPTPQFKRINSLALSLFHSPTLTLLCWQSNVSAFEYAI